ncbi:mitochondrial ribosomal protein MRP51 [Poronia punctata]|nr:mitochondrial ribosomal protein MRP51 [Poronia punctata]
MFHDAPTNCGLTQWELRIPPVCSIKNYHQRTCFRHQTKAQVRYRWSREYKQRGRTSKMSATSMSPGAALLRTSRMFSVPAPISVETQGSSTGRWNLKTKATTRPFPTHLTVTTTATSRLRGDWGFKRPLPRKTTTRQTYPLLRIRQVDSIEHITDFESASDHSMTLKKFHELNLPISVPVPSKSAGSSHTASTKSVFEEDQDITAFEPDQAEALENKRWKFKGPSLASMSDGNFQKWLDKVVRPRRAEFQQYLKEAYAAELTTSQQEHAVEHQLPVPPKVEASDITDEQFLEYLRHIRAEREIMFQHVSRFLDLAPINKGGAYSRLASSNTDGQNPYVVSGGPPITHPSAGISYLRTASFLENHPLYGPQKQHTSVKCRVVKPAASTIGRNLPDIGIAGFIANSVYDQKSHISGNRGTVRGKALSNIDLDTRGGTKLYYKVDSASVTHTGRVAIDIKEPDSVTELVTKELVGECEEGERPYDHALHKTPRYGTTKEAEAEAEKLRQKLGQKIHIYSDRHKYGL